MNCLPKCPVCEQVSLFRSAHRRDSDGTQIVVVRCSRCDWCSGAIEADAGANVYSAINAVVTGTRMAVESFAKFKRRWGGDDQHQDAL